jgi:hypothetical protein
MEETMAKKGVARVNIYFPEALRDKYEKLSAQTGIPVPDLIRRAMEEFLRTGKIVTIATKDLV